MYKEIIAINYEHTNNLNDDDCRLRQLKKHTANPDHDFNHFGTGKLLNY